MDKKYRIIPKDRHKNSFIVEANSKQQATSKAKWILFRGFTVELIEDGGGE